MAHSLFVFKRIKHGEATYSVSHHEPEISDNGVCYPSLGAVIIDVGLSVGIMIAGRELMLGETVEVIVSEVVT